MRKEGDKSARYITWFTDITANDTEHVGGKAAHIALAYNNKFPVPPGFAITTDAYEHFISKNGLQKHIVTYLNETNTSDSHALKSTSDKIRNLITNAPLPDDLAHAIIDAYDVLDVDKQKYSGASEGALDILMTGHEPPFVAVRSSSHNEDTTKTSFAGQHDSVLNVKGNETLLRAVKTVFASLFSPRAILYRERHGLTHAHAKTGVVIQQMIDSQKSGVIFSQNPLANDDTLFIESAWGLGIGTSSGKINPDRYTVSRAEPFDVKKHTIAHKRIAYTRDSSGATSLVQLQDEISNRETLSRHELKVLSQYARELEELHGSPQQVEFAIGDGETYIIQSRPITATTHEETDTEIDGNTLTKGTGVCNGIVTGNAIIIHDESDIHKVQRGNIIVAKTLTPELIEPLHRASGLITETGGVTSHSAVIARELGVPAITNASRAIEQLHDGQIITIDGRAGTVIEGHATERAASVDPITETKRTTIAVSVDSSEYALRAASSGATTVGLIQLEALTARTGKHAAWYITNETLPEYTRELTDSLRTIAQPFKSVWIRMSDLHSDEYSNLEGSPGTPEKNPLLGNHGIRFSLRNQDFLTAELEAIKDVADQYTDTTFGIMLPHLISLDEIKTAQRVAVDVGLPSNVLLGACIETPAAVHIIEDITTSGISFVNISLDELIQYTLAVDRSNQHVQELYDANNPAVRNALRHVIETCKTHNIRVGVTGRDLPHNELVPFLVEHGIDQITVSAEHASELSHLVKETEEHTQPVQEQSAPEQPIELEQTPTTTESASDEDLILKALEETQDAKDEYRPAIKEPENTTDVPRLNEAIPVSSTDFNQPQQEELVTFEQESPPQQTAPEEEPQYEEQEEEALETAVTEEIAASEQREAIKQEIMKETGLAGQGQEQPSEKKQGNTSLDIF